MNKSLSLPLLMSALFSLMLASCTSPELTDKEEFNSDWKFFKGDAEGAENPEFDDSTWRNMSLPHDWSIEGEFSENHPATAGGGALPGGIGWYRKTFTVEEADSAKLFFIDFDGIYMNSTVWLNGKLLGNRPNGYISFRYEMTPYLHDGENILAVKVDNSMQPNSRWYSGSGIYRNVWLTKKEKVHIGQWGVFVSAQKVSSTKAKININTEGVNRGNERHRISLKTYILNEDKKKVGSSISETFVEPGASFVFYDSALIVNPKLWSVDKPYLYTVLSQLEADGVLVDESQTPLGVRYFEFDVEKGFMLNGEQLKINGVCNHHDLGCLGSAINTRALERQLEILKGMGVNAIRTAHNPPAPELLDLCDRMGFIVMDEMFDMWKKSKSPFDYSLYWDEWHARDLIDFMKRDRNHPSVFIWSIGNEILEQWDSSGISMVKELYALARSVDTTRPITTANNPPSPENNLNKAGILDLVGYNYAHSEYEKHPEVFPGQPFISTESVSGLATRGYYDMPSDSIRRWPKRWDIPFLDGNPGNTVSAYDNVSAPWGSTHAETWKIVKKHDYLAGMFIWTGFDYLGEPTPYTWPSRSSYFGIVDLAGFPKDIYYMYKSEWTDEPVLHIFPHWNWEPGDSVDVWAYFNCEEVELFLNGESLGTKQKEGDNLHVQWNLAFEPGTLKAIGRSGGQEVLTRYIHTAGAAAKIKLTADRATIKADEKDLSFITVDILDANDNPVPHADNLVKFELLGKGSIAGVDNGSQTSHEAFKTNQRKAFNGKCLLIVQSGAEKGDILVKATSEGLQESEIVVSMQ